MSTTSRPTIAFFGATGGCTLNCLILALNAGYECNALIRTPHKLTTLLATHNIDTNATANLHIIPGSADDLPAVRQTLLRPAPTPTDESQPVDLIISGIGSKPKFDSLLRPTLENPTVCQDAMRTVLRALHSLPTPPSHPPTKPKLVVISTTGVDSKRDVPCLMLPLYQWMLKVPHADKKVMEELILAEGAREDPALAGYMIVRPSLLIDGEAGEGLEKVRVGTEAEPAVGYTITRAEVGRWIYENAVVGFERNGGDGKGERGYWGRLVSITH
ncbi:uncharacterized protein BP01DRAFT_401478 [Aspergillus saccharolyticus JOP 1030-1]|uniref:Uncharacterized protein n=1 Tax=Aspergillus saccharolyticus JOP 1030-1 TaxID=1450539 RepID=A0A318ZHL1_9EURO|nr:hypothetical protein BP01DRAFT_401478 [Aspergillus saccharolyticus JOP 1030-1]PYH44053.1 hypothetical protein BP01DRAFT_401478 [Aspergillus saccharolyticus JOP 1030-1]